jgi:hypothetical protein
MLSWISPYPLSATVLWTRQADPDDFLYDFMSAVVRTSVHGVSVIGTTASWELLHDAITHAVKSGVARLFLMSARLMA